MDDAAFNRRAEWVRWWYSHSLSLLLTSIIIHIMSFGNPNQLPSLCYLKTRTWERILKSVCPLSFENVRVGLKLLVASLSFVCIHTPFLLFSVLLYHLPAINSGCHGQKKFSRQECRTRTVPNSYQQKVHQENDLMKDGDKYIEECLGKKPGWALLHNGAHFS